MAWPAVQGRMETAPIPIASPAGTGSPTGSQPLPGSPPGSRMNGTHSHSGSSLHIDIGDAMLQEKEIPDEPASTNTNTTTYTAAAPTTVLVRREPSDISDTTSVLEDIDCIEVLQQHHGWLRISSGWIPSAGWAIPATGDASSVHPQATSSSSSSSSSIAPPPPTAVPPRVPQVLSSSLPERGATSSRYCLMPSNPTRVVRNLQHRSSDFSLAGLNLERAEGPTLKPSVPVQRGARSTSQKRREHHRRADYDDDYMWLLGNMTLPDAGPGLSIKQVVLEETRPVGVGTLLWAWGCAIVGVLAYSITRAKSRSLSDSHLGHTVLVNVWLQMAEVAAMLACVLIGTLAASVQGTLSREKWSVLCDTGGMILTATACIAFAASFSLWLMGLNHLTEDSALFFVSSHPAVVLLIRSTAGGSSGWGEKVGAAVIILGSACFGLSDYLIPSDERDHPSESQPGLGILYSLLSCVLFALSLVAAKHVRLQKDGLRLPLTAFLLLLSVSTLVGLLMTLFLGYRKTYHFSKDQYVGALGWLRSDLLTEVSLLGALSGVGLLGLLGALRVLPAVIVSSIFALQPSLIFLSDLATSSIDRPVPLPTQSVGALCIIAGCICVCRAAVSAVPLLDESLSSTSGTPRHFTSESQRSALDERQSLLPDVMPQGHHTPSPQRVRRVVPRRVRQPGRPPSGTHPVQSRGVPRLAISSHQRAPARPLGVHRAPEEEPTPRRSQSPTVSPRSGSF